MGDNVMIPTGEHVAYDDAAGVFYQRVKIADGTTDGTACVPADATYGLDVDVTRLPTVTVGTMPLTTVIDSPHQEIHDGDSFCFNGVFTLDSGGVKSYMLTTANADRRPHLSYESEGVFGFSFDIYEGSDRTGSTGLLAYNRNRASTTTATLAIDSVAAGGTTDGTRIVQRVCGSGTSTGKLSGTSNEATEWLLAKNTKYVLKITSSANNNTVGLRLNWYEHTL